MNKKILQATSLLFFSLVFSLCKKDKGIKIESERESGSTISLRNFTRDSFDKDGVKISKLTAEESFIFFDENRTVFYSLVFDQFKDGKFESSLKGDRGEVNHTTKKLNVNGNIVLNTVDHKRLEAEELLYDIDEQTLVSDKSVIVNSRGTTIRGIGLRADKNLNKVTILKPTAISKEGNPLEKNK
ncbi:MAG: LPS export ABC transporter periplasmic protein LptC [Leptospiraceae bacterium]|nr:LPS export ABC transporter periplasmic protein LptC [Leptospiraceae bacterium]MCK6379807.1 LPS export ABC transporter periplasmic protein LptC [Leptospiraceae bacterium]NUM41538.1 LPS export ABC transporter periplasmic protein LptC [Leptospiraceae bacterium]